VVDILTHNILLLIQMLLDTYSLVGDVNDAIKALTQKMQAVEIPKNQNQLPPISQVNYIIADFS
jgi:hypothetical protein